MYGAEVVVYFEINTNHINTVWAERILLNIKPVGASHNQYALKGYNVRNDCGSW